MKNKYNQVCKEIDNHLKVICHYDFECRNIIFLESKEAGILDFQDAMIQGEPWMYHSHIGLYLNCGLLSPLECVQAAEQSYHDGDAPLNLSLIHI